MTSAPTIVDFVTGAEFLALTLSPAQETLLRAIYGLALTDEQLEIWRLCTGREAYPGVPFEEITVIAGARAGKDSRIACPIALYEAIFGGHEARLSRGERGIIPLVAQDQRATRVAFSYIRDYVMGSAMLRQMVDEPRESELWLTNGMRVVSFACTAKSVRGWSIPCGIMDELAFYRIESGADADVEVQTAIRRGMAGFAHGRLIKISTPYIKGGVLYDDFARSYGKPDPDLLVWQAPSVLMNPTLNQRNLARQQRMDATRYAREFEAMFSDDLEAFLPGAWIEAATIEGRHELPATTGLRYIATADPSGGAVKGDSFTLSIVHPEGNRFVQDVMKAWASSRSETVNLAAVVAEIAAILRRYGLHRVTGDHYAGVWPKQEFQKVGIYYEPAELSKSQAYLEFEPRLAQGRVELLDHPTLQRELRQLERRWKPGGRVPTIDHPKGGHDDCANALALGIAELAKSMHPAIGGTLESFSRDDEPSRVEATGGGFFGRVGPTTMKIRAAREAAPADVEPRSGRGSIRFWR